MRKFIRRTAIAVGVVAAGITLLNWRMTVIRRPQAVPGLQAINVPSEGAGSRRIHLPDGTSILLGPGGEATVDSLKAKTPWPGFIGDFRGEAVIELGPTSKRLMLRTPIGQVMFHIPGRYVIRGTDAEQLLIVERGRATAVEVRRGIGHARTAQSGEAVLVRPGGARGIFVVPPKA